MAAAKEGIKQKVRGWSHHDSADLYGIDDWGNGYFRINKKGEVTVRLNDEDGGKKDISLCDLLEGLKERGTTVPVLFRFRDLLRSRIAELNDSFRKAIKEADYQGKYQGVYPIKVNQQRQVVEEIAEFGTKYDYGLEAGSKPELIAAMAHMHNPNGAEYFHCAGNAFRAGRDSGTRPEDGHPPQSGRAYQAGGQGVRPVAGVRGGQVRVRPERGPGGGRGG